MTEGEPNVSAVARMAATIRRFGTAPGVLIVAAAAVVALVLPAMAAAAPPDVTIKNASNLTATTADLEGSVDPKGQSTSWRFEYLTDTAYSENLQNAYPPFLGALTGPTGSTSVAGTITGQLTELQANTTYHLRLVAENADGPGEAVAAGTFATSQAAPLVNTYDPHPIGSETAVLDGVVDTRNAPGTYWFEWGTEDCEVSGCESTAHASSGFNEIQEISPPYNETGEGEWSLSFDGQTTGYFPANPTSTTIRVALEGLSSIGTGNVSVSGASGSSEYLITFTGALANTDVKSLTAENGPNPLPGGIGIKTVLQGGYRTSTKHVTQSLSGLQPETTYHFRLVAENPSGKVETPDREFTTGGPESGCPNQGMPGSSLLPDCRAYELVSPTNGKNGADAQAESHFSYSSTSGNGFAYITSAGFGDVRGTTASAQYVARRTGVSGTNGWSSHNVSPVVIAPDAIAGGNGNLPGFEAFNPELTGAVYRSWSTLPGDPDPKVSEITNFYRLENLDSQDPSAQLVTGSKTTIPTDPYTKRTLKNAYVGASRDLSRVFFQSPWNLTTNGTPTANYAGEYFEYSDANGVRAVGRIPTGSDTQCDDGGGTPCVATEASPALYQEIHVRSGGYSENTISTDGSRVLFNATGALYMREDGNVSYLINASERTPATEPRPAAFQAMTPDGSRIFFTTQEPLVNEDEDPFSTDLYMYEVDKPVGHRLTLLSGRSTEAEAKQVIQISADGHYVYFTAFGQLVQGEPLGQRNGLYLWHDGSVSFIGNFGENDATPASNSVAGANFATPLANLSSRITPDGRTLLFMSEESGSFTGRGGFAGHNNGGFLCNTSPIGEPSPIGAHQPCRMLYLYSADTGRIICVSCNPESDVSTADALTDARFSNTVNPMVQHLSNALSNDGNHVFFTSGEALVPEDTNGNTDAYEYDVQSESIHLISSGTDSQGAVFLDASPDGRNAFFVTTQQLVGWDTDNNADVYDARVDGGFPEPVPVPAGCQGESCLPSSPPAPSAPRIASPSPKPGNPVSPRHCPKGSKSVTKHGKSRCVKKARAKHKRASGKRRAGR